MHLSSCLASNTADFDRVLYKNWSLLIIVAVWCQAEIVASYLGQHHISRRIYDT